MRTINPVLHNRDMGGEKSEDLARERAPTESEFEIMLKGIEENLDGEMRLQCKFLLYTIGRLGLRAGELTHMDREWVKLHQQKIDIQWNRCNCSYCKKRARSKAKHNDVSFDEAMSNMWDPKSSASERTVYFNFSQVIEDLYKQFFGIYDEWPTSRATVNRRVDRIVENSDVQRDPSEINPESLRAAAATYHADKRMNPKLLTKMMGWEKEETALKFMRNDERGLKSELDRIHNN